MGISETCSGSTACTIVLQYVIPSLGAIASCCLCISPLPTVNRCVLDRKTGSTNTLPYALCAANSLVWITYSWYIKDYFVFSPNVFGYLASLYFTLVLLPISPPEKQGTTIKALLGLSGFVLISVGVLVIADVERETGLVVMGVIANLVLIIFYASPLAVCWKVIKERDSSALDALLTLATAINCILWSAYGIALGNYFIAVPNGLGLVFSLFQGFLIWRYGRAKQDVEGGGAYTPAASGLLPRADDDDSVKGEMLQAK
ncbi:hypothetical protein BCR33DRAFT_703951 [Rhizoclosmatium globosum]|uniref:Sugar transporter SWEET1 n=1 Tax=Rhizoclosmatium globosum TaxID=329046 RepID=A0A1Y2B359_9FUNG|nr:hypothetical protein BCR33DRAFT_703951 [Rhizoclosmatium globosum]|eukprot:ORY28927.1 hypothetical protein BCR33DRAFT_703951 [Rhizoclosmatium globosum]